MDDTVPTRVAYLRLGTKPKREGPFLTSSSCLVLRQLVTGRNRNSCSLLEITLERSSHANGKNSVILKQTVRLVKLSTSIYLYRVVPVAKPNRELKPLKDLARTRRISDRDFQHSSPIQPVFQILSNIKRP